MKFGHLIPEILLPFGHILTLTEFVENKASFVNFPVVDLLLVACLNQDHTFSGVHNYSSKLISNILISGELIVIA